ncbi:MAG: glycosyltransferase family 4 protein, partial [Candidatus Eisenbacteria bacterium]|nr:glycosyltransferase family 4 protein [Candidatus Eisenbacteria bacterium]
MNLAILIGQFPPGVVGGAELQAEQWARRLAASHQVTVITRGTPASSGAPEHRDGFDVVRIAASRVPIHRTFADVAAIREAVRTLDPRPDLMLCFQTFVSGYAGVRAQRAFGIPAVVWVRGEGEIRLRRSWFTRWTSPAVWDEARGVLVQSHDIATVLQAELGEASDRWRRLEPRLAAVPNGIEMPAETNFETRGGRVLAVGRLIADKGVDVVIDAVAGMQGLLTIIGDGPERERLEARASHHGLDARFRGFLAAHELAAEYRAAACVVLASRRGEGFPNVVLEAMSHGCAVVVSRVPGMAELVRDGENGLVVAAGDPAALRDALARLAHERG